MPAKTAPNYGVAILVIILWACAIIHMALGRFAEGMLCIVIVNQCLILHNMPDNKDKCNDE